LDKLTKELTEEIEIGGAEVVLHVSKLFPALKKVQAAIVPEIDNAPPARQARASRATIDQLVHTKLSKDDQADLYVTFLVDHVCLSRLASTFCMAETT
jgi:hypothetical protein